MPVYKPIPPKALIESALDIEKQIRHKNIVAERERRRDERAHDRMHEATMRTIQERTSISNRYAGFVENLKNNLLETALYEIFSDAMQKVNESVGNDFGEFSPATMHSMLYSFIHENGGAGEVLFTMEKNSRKMTMAVAEVTNYINEGFKRMLADVDRTNPGTFSVDKEYMHQYKKGLKACAIDQISDSISDRVVAAIQDFITQNAEDKKEIVNALEDAKDKIEGVKGKDAEEIKEGYAMFGRRKVLDVRNKPKSLFSEMVTTMAETVVNDSQIRNEFLTESSNLDVAKIINKTAIMYGFLETASTMQLTKVDSNYIAEVIDSIKGSK